MTAKKLFLFWIMLVCQMTFAQQDSIALKEVIVSDSQLRQFSRTQSVSVLNDSVVEKNAASLTSLLNYNSVIYFKENGLGMVASPSFRGTTAQQTAVIWNGININSQLNGLTDFNTITMRGFDNVTVRAGGGSSIYGSSAIGGSIHLNNFLQFKNRFTNELQTSYGSFNTFGANYKVLASNETVSSQVSISRNSSENDYEYPDTNKHNENGKYYNTSLNAGFGYKISNVHFLKLYSQVFEGERHFSGTLSAKSKSKYQDLNSRNLIEWEALLSKWTSRLKVAFLSEQYKYFENAKSLNFETSKAETVISKYDLNYAWSPKISINAVFDYTQTKGFGMQIGENQRSISSGALFLKHQLFRRFNYEISLRKEITDNYKSPLLFSFGTRFDASKQYSLLVNVSRNFRIPTFNDLYWQGAGNPDLKPENSYQAEIGQRFKYKSIFVSATAYYIDITDMIQWKPDSNGNWRPNNVTDVSSYGAELMLDWNKKSGNHVFGFNVKYGYTVSENRETKQQLIYVPFHKLVSGLAYSYKNLSANYQYLFNGYVYTTSDNEDFLKEYMVSNFGIDYDFGTKKTYKLGFQVLNLWNENYQSVAQRPMPGRNYSINLIFKF